jgi:hypothetical protein
MEHNLKNKRKIFFLIPIIIAGLFVFTGIVMLLWNAILSSVLAVKTISFWQAMGILILSKILFGGVRFGVRNRPFSGNKIKDKFMNMSNEEKEDFKQEWKQRCGR